MKIEYTHTRADYVAFNKIATNSNLRKRKFIFLFALFFAVLALIEGPTDFWKFFGPFQFAAQIGLILLGLLVLTVVMKRRLNAKCDEEFSNSSLADPVTIKYDDKGLTSEQIHQKTFWKWSAFHKVTVEDGNIFLWFGRLQAVMIPSRAIEGDEQRNELIDYFDGKIGKLSGSPV